MSIRLLERALDVMGVLAEEVVFVGGSTVPLHVIDDGGTNYRPTLDVDAVVQAASRIAYERFAVQLRKHGLSEDMESNVICRWRSVEPELILDLMPDAERVFGFGNRWYPHVVAHPVTSALPSGRVIRHSSAGALLAMKLEAYADRGARDPLISHDLEDMIRVIDTRPDIVDELMRESADVRSAVRQGLRSILSNPRAHDAIPLLMLPDAQSERRAFDVVLPRMRAIAGM